MKNKVSLYLILCFLINFTGYSQSAVFESLSFDSNKLGRKVSYSIYLPSDYNVSKRNYPVLYLLHGYTDNETNWIQMGQIKTIADRAIANEEAVPMIIVMPDAWDTWYINQYDGKAPYEDMFFQELIPYMEKTYHIRSDRESRAIAGLSMGGDDDRLLDGNVQVHQIMREKGIKHEFRVRDGGHSWTYWRTALPEVLLFVSQTFCRS